ncbi:HET-domain-containing protein [Ganoderma leucocontextum]|nr:HET-domain-containing protein [Ganoderma leucocontextum]
MPRSTNPRDHASPKIRQSCAIAERHGYKWIWNDTCCIDKSSSSDLSEAINSMYQYYSLAEVCYAFLEDVPGDGMSIGDYVAFRNSRWHRRGWTLQELIAPSFLVFLSRDWEVLWTKADLADVLQRHRAHDMGFLARDTTRVEDEAYCLMGIFSINMTTLYGEGRQAFYRLQEKIMKRSVDTSLFLWGKRDLLAWHFDFGLSLHDEPEVPRDFVGATTFVYAPPKPAMRALNHARETPLSDTQILKPVMVPEFTITPYGVRALLPVIETSLFLVAIPFWLQSTVLAPVGLILVPCTSTAHPSRTLYHTRWHNGWAIQRVILFEGTTDNLRVVEPGRPVTPEWREIYIAHRPPPDIAVSIPLHTLTGSSVSSPFRFTKQGMSSLFEHEGRRSGWELESVDNLSKHRGGQPFRPVVLTFKQRQYALDVTDRIVVLLDLCAGSDGARSTQGSSTSGQSQVGHHWASVHFYHVGERPPLEPLEHACPTDHICVWDGPTRTFEDTQALLDRHSLAFSFSPCPINPRQTLVVSMSYKGEWKGLRGDRFQQVDF